MAEIISVFPTAIIDKQNHNLAYISGITQHDIKTHKDALGGTIRIVKIIDRGGHKGIEYTIGNYLYANHPKEEEKIIMSISPIDTHVDGLRLGLNLKKHFKEHKKKIRCINKGSDAPQTAQLLSEKMIEKGYDFTIVEPKKNSYIIGRTVHIQDINAYTKRDMGRARNMIVGMLPPKLAQIMLNLGRDDGVMPSKIYDPFCGLGTVLIEALNIGTTQVYGSDKSAKMCSCSEENIGMYDVSMDHIMRKDATEISEVSFTKDATIITEGYLGRIYNQESILDGSLPAQQDELRELYRGFLSSALQGGAKKIVISIPFWRTNDGYAHIDDFSSIITEAGWKHSMIPLSEKDTFPSLRYIRPSQTVGREIYVLEK